MKTLYILSITLLFYSSISQAQSDTSLNVAKLQFDLQNNIDELINQSNTTNEAKKIANQIKKYSSVINDKIDNDPKSIPQYYLLGIQNNVNLIDQANSEKDITKAIAILKDVENDLKIKASLKSMGASEILITGINVTVRTRRKGVEENGYIVVCNPKRYYNNNVSMFTFNNASSPTSRILPPGNYVLILTKGQSKITRNISIGANGPKDENIIVDVE